MGAKPINRFASGLSDKVIIFIFPILLTFLNSNWTFSPATDFLPDPWFYLGYFRYYFNYAPNFPSNIHYFVERITWNLPGYLIYHVFPPLVANYVLHFVVCYIALFSMYGTLHILFNRRTALLSALLMGGYPWFLRAVGWDYVDGVGIAHMLLLIFILTKSRGSERWQAYLFLAGFIHTSLLITNLFWLGFAPSWGLYHLYYSRPTTKDKPWRLVREAGYFLLGTIALVLIVAYHYFVTTGDSFFLRNSFAFSLQQSHNEGLINFINTVYGRMPAYWHILPGLIVIGLLRQAISVSKTSYYHSYITTTLFMVATYGLLIFWHSLTLPYLIIFLYSSFAIPAVSLTLGTYLATPLENLAQRDFNTLIVTTILLLSIPFYLIVFFPSLQNLQGNILLIIGSCLIFIVVTMLKPNKVSLFTSIVSLSLLSYLTGLNSYVHVPDPLKGRDNFSVIIKSSNIIDTYYPNHKYNDFRFWYREDVNYSTIFNLSALYLYPWGSALDRPVSGKIPPPILSLDKTDQFVEGDNIVIVSSNPRVDDILAEANRALSPRNAYLVLDTIQEVRNGSLSITLYFTKINMKSQQ